MRSLDGSHYRDLKEITSCSGTGGFYDRRCDFSAQVSGRPIHPAGNIPTRIPPPLPTHSWAQFRFHNPIQENLIGYTREETEFNLNLNCRNKQSNSKKIPLRHKSWASLHLTSVTARYWSGLNFSWNLCIPLISSAWFLWEWNIFLRVLDFNKVNTAFCNDALFEIKSCLFWHV